MKFVRIKNLEKYHPGYKDRSLIWCKVYFSMINSDPEFEMLCEVDKWRFIAFIILQLQSKKSIPLDEAYLKRKGFDLKNRAISLTIQMLHNFIEVCNDLVTQSRVDKSRVEESRVDTNDKNIKRDKPFSLPSLKDVESYIKEKGYNVDAKTFYDYFTESNWVDSKGQKVKNWKQKIITWSSRGGNNGRSKRNFEQNTKGKFDGIGQIVD